ncbi:MAG: DUF2089 domain-containing protein [Anaerolineae bacterium]|nr:DUF2089 domain-containing protein [Anaerolineae bacterium]
MRKILEHCPSCDSDLLVTRMSCPTCGTVVLGMWAPCRFCQLSPEHTRLLEALVRSKGNVKEMARDLDASYWTVRKQLDDLIEALGYEPPPPAREDTTDARAEILEKLDRGELGADEAVALLGELNSD